MQATTRMFPSSLGRRRGHGRQDSSCRGAIESKRPKNLVEKLRHALRRHVRHRSSSQMKRPGSSFAGCDAARRARQGGSEAASYPAKSWFGVPSAVSLNYRRLAVQRSMPPAPPGRLETTTAAQPSGESQVTLSESTEESSGTFWGLANSAPVLARVAR
jgi:hypothetical protein